MNWLSEFFSWRGRFNRRQFLYSAFGVNLIAALLVVGAIIALERTHESAYRFEPTGLALIAALYAPAAASTLSMFARRLHDLGFSAWLILAAAADLALIIAALTVWPQMHAALKAALALPFAAAFACMLALPGQPSENRHGSAPRGR